MNISKKILCFEKEKCIECIKKRTKNDNNLLEDERNKKDCLSPFQTGCHNNIDPKKKNILFLTQSHSGKNDDLWKTKSSNKKFSYKDENPIEKDIKLNEKYINGAIEQSYKYHFRPERELTSYFQLEISNILKNLDNKANLYLIDIVKCYIKNGDENFESAYKYCEKYLQKQIEKIDPDIIVLFGHRVTNSFYSTFQKNLRISNDIKKGESKKKEFTSLYNITCKKHQAQILAKYNKNCPVFFSIFPSSNTADLWVKYNISIQNKNKLLEEIKKLI